MTRLMDRLQRMEDKNGDFGMQGFLFAFCKQLKGRVLVFGKHKESIESGYIEDTFGNNGNAAQDKLMAGAF